MRISRYKRKFGQRREEPRYRANEKIRAPEVRIIDEEGNHLGVMPPQKALALAEERGYDLVEVAPNANPPTCRLLNYGQFKYEQEKLAKKQKAQVKKTMVKGVRLSLRIGEHDLEVRREKARKFLKEGHKAQIELILRGRERALARQAREVMQTFAESLDTDELKTKIEQPFQRQGGRMTMVVATA